MAIGNHWEWRAFGAVTDSFIDRYGRLNYQFGPQQVEDLYIWAPELLTNVKIREGADGGLKFKRLLARDGRLECWSEDPAELFAFPLGEQAWQALATELAKTNRFLGSYPAEAAAGDALFLALKNAGCRTVLVRKERGGRWLQGANGRVLVEWTSIHKPQPVLSIGLESEDLGLENEGLAAEQAKEDLRGAIRVLELDHEPLVTKNYMDALALWATGDQIVFPGR